jgi:nucleotide-binding universal stress UspA family protein
MVRHPGDGLTGDSTGPPDIATIRVSGPPTSPRAEARMTRFQTVLVATDGTEDSDGAVEAALDLAHDTGARLLVLTVVPEGAAEVAEGEDAPPSRRSSSERGEDDEITEAQERTDTVIDHATEWGLEAQSIIWEGEPAAAILAAAASEGADVIVIGTHGRSGVGRMLLGSTSDDVIRNADVPVLVVRNPRERE